MSAASAIAAAVLCAGCVPFAFLLGMHIGGRNNWKHIARTWRNNAFAWRGLAEELIARLEVLQGNPPHQSQEQDNVH